MSFTQLARSSVEVAVSPEIERTRLVSGMIELLISAVEMGGCGEIARSKSSLRKPFCSKFEISKAIDCKLPNAHSSFPFVQAKLVVDHVRQFRSAIGSLSTMGHRR